ncbi:MAG: YihY/virulence factor BrkB family protein [Chryseobacterium sp.]|nr:MAG: YihY/virulence factor BrkB family protein [Chryseobacterium sp.]
MPKKLPRFLIRFRDFLDSIHLPALDISLLKMFEIYGEGIFKNPVVRQAAGISWAFFLSLFPFILFLLSILPYLPHYESLQFYIFDVLMTNIFPAHMHSDVSKYIQESIMPNLKGINNIATIAFALVFATNGTHSLINGFNLNTDQKRPFVKEYLIAFGITVAFITIIIASLLGIYYAEVVLKLFKPEYTISWFVNNLSKIIGFISFPVFYFILISLLYWAGCLKIRRYKEAIPGSVFSLVLFILTTYFFAYYVSNFARYNVLYGSIGSILLLMIWVNVNIVLILFGNELNIAIKKIKTEKIIADAVDESVNNFEHDAHAPVEDDGHHSIRL